jgi:hypothetical protein
MATRAEKKRARELVDTLVWDLPEMEPKLGTLPPNPEGLEFCAEFEVLPGIKAVCFPDGDSWRGLLVQYDPATGQVTSMMEHQIRAQSDDDAARWAQLVIYDILASAVKSAASEAAAAMPRERLARVSQLLELL